MKRIDLKPDWKWGTPGGSREFDRIHDRAMTFREKLEWLEKSEALALRMQASLKRRSAVTPDAAGDGSRG